MRNVDAQIHGSHAAADLQLAATPDDYRAADASAVVSDTASPVALDDACSQLMAARHSHRTASASAVASDNASVGGISGASGMDDVGRRMPAGHKADNDSVGMSTP